MRKLNFLATVLSLALCSNANATSVTDSLRAAYKYNPDLLKSITNVELQKEKSLGSLASFLPSVSFQSQRNVSKDRNPLTKNTPINYKHITHT